MTTSLIDVFMPNDLCARCDEEEAVTEFRVTVERDSETAKLAFCTERCQEAFVRGAQAVKELPDAF